MKFFFKILIILSIVFLYGCKGKKEKEIILDNVDLEIQMIASYKAGIEALESGDALFAAKNFNVAENLYPQSIWAPKSVLMAAYSYYSQDYYGDAISELERFLKMYPVNEHVPYAHFLLATCYYELIVDEKKDISPLLQSKKEFKHIIDNYPNTDFALDAKFKLILINNLLASKEMYIGRYYLQKEKWIAAINRFKIVVNSYDETDYIEEAIHRLVEVNYKLGLENEAKKYAALLGYNYLSSKWYKESYKVFNKDYLDPRVKLKKNKQKFIIRKFKGLFD